jgi:hypothetical protein
MSGGFREGEERFQIFRVFCGSLNCAKLPPPSIFVCWRLIFIGKILFGPQTWSVTPR